MGLQLFFLHLANDAVIVCSVASHTPPIGSAWINPPPTPLKKRNHQRQHASAVPSLHCTTHSFFTVHFFHSFRSFSNPQPFYPRKKRPQVEGTQVLSFTPGLRFSVLGLIRFRAHATRAASLPNKGVGLCCRLHRFHRRDGGVDTVS